MRINFSHNRKTIAGSVFMVLVLLVTGWTLARNHPSTPPPPFLNQASPQTTATDQPPLVKKVYAALAKQPKLKDENIKVEAAEGGKVKITGKASHHTKQALAIQTAEKAAGKNKVINALVTECGGITCEPPNHCCDCPLQPPPGGCVCQQFPCPNPKPKKAK